MAKTANVNVRMEPELKQEAEEILDALGVPASNAVTMFYKQIVMHKGLSFDVQLPEPPLDFSKMSVDKIDTEIQKGYQEILDGKGIPASEVFQELREKYED